jgi:co-chaperonin GroES (HSP10)
MQLKPLRDLVLVQRDLKRTTTASGIALPDTLGDEELWVEILAAGPIALERGIKVGSKMLLRQWCGMRLDEERGFQSQTIVQAELLEAVQVDG